MPDPATFRRWLIYGWVLAIAAVLYVAWIGVSRHMANRALERAAEAKRASAYKPLPETGPGVKILHFYAGTGEVVRGEHVVVCYGVQNAKAVRLEPPVETITPSLNRCIAVEPSKDTTYVLHATGKDGSETSASFTIRVVLPPAPRRSLWSSCIYSGGRFWWSGPPGLPCRRSGWQKERLFRKSALPWPSAAVDTASRRHDCRRGAQDCALHIGAGTGTEV